jgi:hypothetical protein
MSFLSSLPLTARHLFVALICAAIIHQVVKRVAKFFRGEVFVGESHVKPHVVESTEQLALRQRLGCVQHSSTKAISICLREVTYICNTAVAMFVIYRSECYPR